MESKDAAASVGAMSVLFKDENNPFMLVGY